MSIGNSGRIVIEIDAALKRELYAHLEKEHLTLKGWFIKSVNSYLEQSVQPSLFAVPQRAVEEVTP